MFLILPCSYSRSTELGKDILLYVESFILYTFFIYNYQITLFSFSLHTLKIKKAISLSESSYTSLFKPRTPENWGQQDPISRGDLGSWGSKWMMKQQRVSPGVYFAFYPAKGISAHSLQLLKKSKKCMFFFPLRTEDEDLMQSAVLW